MRVEGKSIIITGGAGSLGNQLIEFLLSHGAKIIAIDRDEKGLEQLSKVYSDVDVKVCDLTDFDEVHLTMNELCKSSGPPDVLINNVGALFNMPLVGFKSDGLCPHDVDMWDKMIAINLNSTFYVTVNIIPHMIKKRIRGVIVNIGSISAAGNPGQSAYAASKAGIEALTKVWAAELGPLGIRVACIAPGFFNTSSTRKVLSEENLKQIRSEIPLRRLGQTEEIANAVLFVLENDYFNGRTLQLDGGMRI